MRLLDHAGNVFSQSGEDGIIAFILKLIEDADNWCVEFGAWDGTHLSNTCNLIENSGYSAVLIEGDAGRFEDLKKRCADHPNRIPVNRFVGFSADDGLDAILRTTPIPRGFDLLSIDIDGNDYHVWKAVREYQPKIVCIEYNPTVPTGVDFVQPADMKVSQGCGLTPLARLGAEKGYELVAVTGLNAIFVLAKYFPRFEIQNNDPVFLREDHSAVTHIFSGYDGTVLLSGSNRLPWHGLSYSGRIRQMPAMFRKHPDGYPLIHKKLFSAYKKILRLIRHY